MNKKVINKYLEKKKLDGLFILSTHNIFWYANINVTNGFLMINKNNSELFVDSRYIIEAKNNAKNVNINFLKMPIIKSLKKSFKKKYKKIGYESNYVTIDQYKMIKNIFPKAELIAINGQSLRNYKSKEEVDKLRKASRISLRAFEELKSDTLSGKTEIELAAKLEFLLIKHGATKYGFNTIVASGKNGAKPHAIPSNKKLKNGEFCTFDFGAVYKGYTSDITRTIQIGEVTNNKLLKIYKIIEKAQKKGITAIMPGITAAEIDQICRNYIISKGYGDYFLHNTGHGLGVEVHELPNIIFSNNAPLRPGHVITVEPGIYIKGLGGVRIEDDILVTETGYEILSRITKTT